VVPRRYASSSAERWWQLGISYWCHSYFYRLTSIIILKYEYKVIIKNKYSIFWGEGGWILRKDTDAWLQKIRTRLPFPKPTCVDMDFLRYIMTWTKYRNKTEAEADCRKLYQISNWRAHTNSLISHNEKLTHNNLFGFSVRLNR